MPPALLGWYYNPELQSQLLRALVEAESVKKIMKKILSSKSAKQLDEFGVHPIYGFLVPPPHWDVEH